MNGLRNGLNQVKKSIVLKLGKTYIMNGMKSGKNCITMIACSINLALKAIKKLFDNVEWYEKWDENYIKNNIEKICTKIKKR